MKKEAPNNLLINNNWFCITPIEFERILKLYGMQYKTYSELRGKCHSWFYSVLRKKKYLSYTDINTFAENIGEELFNILVSEIKGEIQND